MNATAAATRSLAGVEVGAVGLGCMGMSWAYGQDGSGDDPVAVIRRALDLGVDLIDTADVYGPFTNEELVGRALRGHRDRAFLTTKTGLVQPGEHWDVLESDGRPEHVREAIDASLTRLGTDHVDLYQLHRVDPEVPLADTWGAMAATVAAGKARAIGLSEVTVAQLAEAAAIHPVATVETELSLQSRGELAEVVPWCEEHGTAFIAYSPLGRGFLTGTLDPDAGFGPDDLRSVLPRFTGDGLAEGAGLLDVVRAVAARYDATPGQVALAWVLAQSPVTFVIPGTRRLSRLEENAGAGRLELDADHLAALDAAPRPTRDRY